MRTTTAATSLNTDGRNVTLPEGKTSYFIFVGVNNSNVNRLSV